MEDFYVTISTNNTESTTHLAAPKILDKKYKVGLVSLYMNIPELYGNITVTYTSILHKQPFQFTKTLTKQLMVDRNGSFSAVLWQVLFELNSELEATIYEEDQNIAYILQNIKDEPLKLLCLEKKSLDRKIEFNNNRIYFNKFYKIDFTGFSKQLVETTDSILIKPDISNCDRLFVFCDIIEFQNHNEKLLQCLKVTPIAYSKSKTDSLFLDFRNIEYLSLSRFCINSISISIRDQYLNRLDLKDIFFEFKLHFKNGL